MRPSYSSLSGKKLYKNSNASTLTDIPMTHTRHASLHLCCNACSWNFNHERYSQMQYLRVRVFVNVNVSRRSHDDGHGIQTRQCEGPTGERINQFGSCQGSYPTGVPIIIMAHACAYM